MPKEKSTAQLNIFLIKESVSRRDQIIKNNTCNGPLEVRVSGAGKGYLYWKSNYRDHPKWVSLFAQSIDITQIGGTSNVSAAFVLKVEGRYFVLAFGQGGRFLIEDDVCEERFGLLVALNSVDKASFRCIDKQSLDSIQSHTRIQSGQETTADQFGLDVEQDMLKAIVGAPKDVRLGNRMTGTDSLSVSVKMDLSDLPFLLKSYKEKFDQDLNATDYEWVNNISIVKNSSALVSGLENSLIEKFHQRDYSNIWLSIPEIIDWDLVRGFVYTGGRNIIHADVELDGFLSSVSDNHEISIDLLKSRRVYCADSDHNHVFRNWPVYKCLYAEIDYGGSKFILNDGKWFNVSFDFVERTNSDFKKIDISPLVLPLYGGGGEGKYNQAVCQSSPEKYVLLDDANKIFHGGGHGQVEVCDILSTNKQLIHVKIYGKSSVLSHLFSQGFVSGQLLQLDAEFRRKVKEKLDSPFNELIKVETRPIERDFTIIYAVISDSPGEDLHLPFFSRVNLNNTSKVLKGFGYNVELLKIKVDEIHAKTKKCPPKKKKRKRR